MDFNKTLAKDASYILSQNFKIYFWKKDLDLLEIPEKVV